MREDASETKRVLEKHEYSITNIIFDAMKTFKLNASSSVAPQSSGSR